MPTAPGNLLCAANFPSNTGYAWDNIERLFARVADRLEAEGIATWVSYPRLSGGAPQPLEGSAAKPLELDTGLATGRSIREVVRFIRRERIRVVYMTDRPVYHRAYPILRTAGVRYLVVHDRTSGERTPVTGLRRFAKGLVARGPFYTADVVLAVSDYVAHRQATVGCVPRSRIVTVRNAFPVEAAEPERRQSTHECFGVPSDRPIVACACRASAEKGVHHLLRAFDALVRELPEGFMRPVLVVAGDGPQLEELRALAGTLETRDDIRLVGYVRGAVSTLRDASLFVVPSVWQDAFPSSVLEPMALGKAVVATAVGGIPEMIEHRVSGLLIPPANERALVRGMRSLLLRPKRARAIGRAARARVAAQFNPEAQLDQVTAVLRRGFYRG